MATATEMSTSFCASDSSLSRKKNCVFVCGCPLAVTGAAVLAESSVVALTVPLTAWPAKQFAAPVSGGVEARACGGPAAWALASAVTAFALVELAVVVVVVVVASSVVALVSESWSLSRRRRAALPLPLWEEEELP